MTRMVVVLPAPLGPRKPVTVPGLAVEADVVDCDEAPVGPREPFHLDHGSTLPSRAGGSHASRGLECRATKVGVPSPGGGCRPRPRDLRSGAVESVPARCLRAAADRWGHIWRLAAMLLFTAIVCITRSRRPGGTRTRWWPSTSLLGAGGVRPGVLPPPASPMAVATVITAVRGRQLDRGGTRRAGRGVAGHPSRWWQLVVDRRPSTSRSRVRLRPVVPSRPTTDRGGSTIARRRGGHRRRSSAGAPTSARGASCSGP